MDRTEGANAGLLMDFEGIPVESYTREESACDVEVVGAEASVIVKAILRTGEMLDVGEMRELSFQSEQMTTLIRIINGSYFLTLTLGPEGNIGKGRFLMRVAAPALAQELI